MKANIYNRRLVFASGEVNNVLMYVWVLLSEASLELQRGVEEDQNLNKPKELSQHRERITAELHWGEKMENREEKA